MALKELEAHPELQNDPSLKDINDVVTLARTYKDTKVHVGNSLRPPGPNASEADRKDFYEKLQKHAPHLVPLVDGDAEAEKMVWTKLGRPSTPAEYDFKLPDGVDLNVDELRTAASVAGFTKKQFEALATKTVEGAKVKAAAHAQEIAGLKTEWATAYETKLKDAAAVAQQMGLPEAAVGAIMAGKLPVAQLKVWDKIATAVGKEEGQGSGGPLTPSKGGMTRQEAQAQFDELQANPAYFNRNAPGHAALVAEGTRLMGILHPG